MGKWVTRAKIRAVFLILISSVFIFLMVWMVVAGPVAVLRILRYGDTSIDDYSHYPGRVLISSEAPFAFVAMQDGIKTPAGLLQMQGLEPELDSVLESNDTIAFLVVQDNILVYERYFQGHTPSSISQLFSITKSFTSALIGTAIEDGYIESVEQPITDFIPELSARGFNTVTIHDLLTMQSGSSYKENDNPFGEHVILNYTPQLEKRILSFKMQDPPGAVFRYKSGDSALLGLALSRSLAPETITQYAQRRLWSPIGMQDGGVFTTDHVGSGLEKTWCCLAVSARDLAKFGQLYLHQGAMGGRQILPSSWVEQSTRTAQVLEAVWPQDYRAIGWRNYGYQWWLASEEDGDYFGLGKDGQFLYVNPGTGTVIVRLGWSSGELFSSQWIGLFQSISRQ